MESIDFAQELKKFEKRNISRLRLFYKYGEFIKTVYFIEHLLTKEQQKLLEFRFEEQTIDFKTQLLLCFEERYDTGLNFSSLNSIVQEVFARYESIFKNSYLQPSQIRTILLRELLEAISLGSQCFYYWRAGIISHAKKKQIKKQQWLNKIWSITKADISFIQDALEQEYPKLPCREFKFKRKEVTPKFSSEFFWNNYNFIFTSLAKQEEWKQEFFRRNRWFLETLNSCEPEFRNKYRERIYSEACISIGLAPNSSHILPLFTHPKKRFVEKIIHFIDIAPNTHIEELVEEVISYFDKKELENLEKLDSKGNSLSFKEQLLQRYYSCYPSVVEVSDLKSKLSRFMARHKSLLLNKDFVEIFFDSLEKFLFVSKNTHVWNREMVDNLFLPNQKVTRGVKWAIELLIKVVGTETAENLYLDIKGRRYHFSELLNARWQRGWLARGKNYFKSKLLLACIKEDIEEDFDMSKFQVLLAELDSCFLFPTERRTKDFLFCKNGTGDISKWRKSVWGKWIETKRSKFNFLGPVVWGLLLVSGFVYIKIKLLAIKTISFLSIPSSFFSGGR